MTAHSQYPGVPIELVHLADALEAGLPANEAHGWPEAFVSAIEPSANLSLVWPRWAHWLLTVELAPYVTDRIRQAVYRVQCAYAQRVSGEPVGDAEWTRAAMEAGAEAAGAARRADEEENGEAAWEVRASGAEDENEAAMANSAATDARAAAAVARMEGWAAAWTKWVAEVAVAGALAEWVAEEEGVAGVAGAYQRMADQLLMLLREAR